MSGTDGDDRGPTTAANDTAAPGSTGPGSTAADSTAPDSTNDEAAADDAAALTSSTGTPYPVDVSGDRRARWIWPVLLGGPVIWFVHFMVVYLVAEAGCTGSGDGLSAFGPPVPRIVSVVATAVAVLACLALAVVAHRRRREQRVEAGREAGDRDPSGPAGRDRADLFTAAMILSLLSAGSVLAVGLPAPFLAAC
ncbi:MAG: hypothetical protein S0880_09550 [Actinomycetota bacterium]|nr:hypothetical protein [Actinomycetota bacterium]